MDAVEPVLAGAPEPPPIALAGVIEASRSR
jgi:hypothetical protein